MKIIISIIFTILIFSACQGTVQKPQTSPPPQALIPNHYKEIVHPPFIYQAPDPKDYRIEISDQIVAYLVEDRSLPWIQMQVYIQESTLPKNPSEAAAVALLGTLYRRGGSKSLTASQVDDTLEFLSAGIGGDLDAYHSTLSLQSLSSDFSSVLGILKQVYFEPNFDSTRLELQKAVYIQNLSHRFDRPSDLVQHLHRHAMYQSNARVWTAKPEEVTAVSRNDLIRLSKDRFARGKMVLAISGDFNKDSMITTLKDLTSQWPTAKEPRQTPVPYVRKSKPGIYIVDKKATQANIRMEQPFVQRPHPDYYPTAVASYILGGGGFTSRLTTRVRSDEGLAYSIYSFASSDYNEPANAGVALQTKIESANYALRIIFDEINKLAAEGPKPEELQSAQQSLIESLPGLFESAHATADIFAKSEVWGRSLNHFKTYPEEILKVTAQDVQRCIKEYFSPEKMTVSIAGPAQVLLAGDSIRNISMESLGLGKPILVPLDSLEMR